MKLNCIKNLKRIGVSRRAPSVWVEIGVVRLGLDADGSKRVGDGVRILLRKAVNDSGLIGEPGFDGVGDVLNRFHGFAFLLTDFVEEIPSVVSYFILFCFISFNFFLLLLKDEKSGD